ncbi:MAG: 3TM-type holin [Nitrospiraceae bacterium]
MLGEIGDMLGRVVGLVDDLHTSDEERLTLKERLLTVQAGILSEVLKAETATLEAQARIVEAEAKSENWITSAWRPITMLTFLALIVYGQFGGPPIPEQTWPLLQLGLGGYVVGRSFEKIVPQVATALKEREK